MSPPIVLNVTGCFFNVSKSVLDILTCCISLSLSFFPLSLAKKNVLGALSDTTDAPLYGPLFKNALV